jgi:hypothetical protein
MIFITEKESYSINRIELRILLAGFSYFYFTIFDEKNAPISVSIGIFVCVRPNHHGARQNSKWPKQ